MDSGEVIDMARGRMISQKTASDKKFCQLGDQSALAFLLAITFADKEGRIPGDPAVLRSMVFPRREDVTIETMQMFIREWADLEMIVWYEAKNDQWIWFPNFQDHQTGLRRDREPESDIPAPPSEILAKYGKHAVLPPIFEGNDREEDIRQNDGYLPEDIRQNDGLREVKLREEKLSESEKSGDSRPNIFSIYEREIGPLTPMIAEDLKLLEKDYPIEWIEAAFREAVSNNVRKLKYVEGILQRWKREGPKGRPNNTPPRGKRYKVYTDPSGAFVNELGQPVDSKGYLLEVAA